MVCLEDVADITLPAGSCRFDYLLAVCQRERLLLEKEERSSNQETDDLIALSDPKEEWRKRLLGTFHGCLSWQRKDSIKMAGTPRRDAPVISHSSDCGRVSSNRTKKRLRFDKIEEEAAEVMIQSKRRIRVPNNGQEPPPGLPVEFKNLIFQLAGNRAVSVEKLVIQKELTKTDVNSTHNRLSIPVRLVREEFLTEEEQHLLCQRKGKNVCSIDEVPFITPMMEVWKVSLRRWEMKKESGVSSVSYVLANTWNEIRKRNQFESKMTVQLWAIRVDADLCMALVRLS